MQVFVLFEGEHEKKSTDNKNVESAERQVTSSCVLLKGDEKNILVDTGARYMQKKLLVTLKHYGLMPEDIDYIICTHGHIDHISNLGIFERATIIMHRMAFYADGAVDVFKDVKFLDIPEVQVIETPGHKEEHISVITKFDGKTYVIAGDAIRDWEIKAKKYTAKQKESAMLILDKADVVIPGHGDILTKEKIAELKKLLK